MNSETQDQAKTLPKNGSKGTERASNFSFLGSQEKGLSLRFSRRSPGRETLQRLEGSEDLALHPLLVVATEHYRRLSAGIGNLHTVRPKNIT
eukprot:1007463-Amphidinium_carterae.1